MSILTEAWCAGHKTMHPVSEFSFQTSRLGRAKHYQGSCREYKKQERRDWGIRTGYKGGEKNLPSDSHECEPSRPIHVTPAPKEYVDGGKKLKRSSHAYSNGKKCYQRCPVTDDCVIDIGHFRAKSDEGSDNIDNLIGVSPSINRLMGHANNPVRCTFYKVGDGRLMFMVEPKLEFDPYYERFHMKVFTLDFPAEYHPSDENLEFHNKQFEKFCREQSTSGRDE